MDAYSLMFGLVTVIKLTGPILVASLRLSARSIPASSDKWLAALDRSGTPISCASPVRSYWVIWTLTRWERISFVQEQLLQYVHVDPSETQCNVPYDCSEIWHPLFQCFFSRPNGETLPCCVVIWSVRQTAISSCASILSHPISYSSIFRRTK